MRLPPHLGRYVVISVALMAAGFFGAYLRFLPYLSNESRYTDGRSVYELSEIDQLRFAVWDEPVPLPPAINTDAHEGRAALSPDGTLLVFAVGEPGLNVDLWVADMVDGEPVDPRPLDRANSIGDDVAPAFDRDALFFASNRPGSRGFDIWRAEYADGVFDAPERLSDALNSEYDETDPAPVPGAGDLVFASDRPRGLRRDLDIYRAVPREAGSDGDTDWDVAPFEAVNTPFDEREPVLTTDALGMVFASDRDGGPGGFDLFHSVQSLGAWQEPERLKGLNTAADERAPALMGDGFTLLFTVAGDAAWDGLVRARSLELYRLPGRRVGWLDLTLLALMLLLALLAWLGRKWETLDVLYKCLLVSLLVHFLLMWWFQEVLMERQAQQIEERARSFQVELAPTTNTLAAAQERDGQMQVTAAREEAGVPDRQELEAPRPETKTSPQASALAQARAAPSRILDAPREPVPVESAKRAQTFDRQAVDVALPDIQVERHADAAPPLALDAQPTQETPAMAATETPVERSSAEMLTPATASIEVSGPATSPLAAPTADAGTPDLQARSSGEQAAPQHQASSKPVAVVQPEVEIEKHAGSAPPMGLQARPTTEAPAAMAEPTRASRAVTDLPSSADALAASTPAAAALPSAPPVAPAPLAMALEAVADAARPERASTERPLALALPETKIERYSGSAPSMALDARPTQASPAMEATETPVERSSAELLSSATASIAVSGPASADLAAPSADAGAPHLQERASDGAPAPQRETSTRSVALVQPSAAIERHRGTAPALGLQPLPIGAAPASMIAPTRASRAVTDLPSVAAALTAGTPAATTLPSPRPVSHAEPSQPGGAARDAARPERASTERPLSVAQPSVEVARHADGGSGSEEAASALDLSSLATASRASGTAGEALAPQRLATEGPATTGSVVAPGSRTLYASTTLSEPPPLRGPEGGTASRPARGLPDVAVDDRSDFVAGGTATSDLPGEDEQELVLIDEHFLATAASGAERERAGTSTPARLQPAWGGGPGPDAGALPQFQPLAVAAVTAAELPSRAEPVPDRWEDTQYRTRFGDAKAVALKEHGGNAETEAAVATGLSYLAQVQGAEGYWGDKKTFDEKYGEMRVGKTGLCLLAFLGAGHTPSSDTQYSETTDRALTALLASQDEETGHFGHTASYSHAIATYALAECFALTADRRLREPLQRAVDWILRKQHLQDDVRFKGGWGYYYPDGRSYDPWPRTSVTVWQVMALESARVGGLKVPDRAFDDSRTFLLNAYNRSEGIVVYNHAPARLNSDYATLPGSTPAGLFALSLLGEKLGDQEYDKAVSWVLDKAPSAYREGDRDAFLNEAEGNLYFWYYGSLAMFRLGGDRWEEWNRQLQDTLLPVQSEDGSWQPISLYARFSGDTEEDRSYTTAMCVLTLEVYYRYFTPLLQVR
ncbi:MAG: hypothetical protein ACYTG2_06950 [Planctomycetota bacterium]